MTDDELKKILRQCEITNIHQLDQLTERAWIHVLKHRGLTIGDVIRELDDPAKTLAALGFQYLCASKQKLL